MANSALSYPAPMKSTTLASGLALRDVTNFASNQGSSKHSLLPPNCKQARTEGPHVRRINFGASTNQGLDDIAACFPSPDYTPQQAADPQFVADYATDVYALLRRKESSGMVSPAYLEAVQTEITAKMRKILVDWLIEIARNCRMCMETLFLAVNIIDRYLAKTCVARSRLQLIGGVAILIAAKFEEIDPPVLRDIIYVMDNQYTKDDALTTEVSIVTALDFSLCNPTPAHFFQRFEQFNGCVVDHRHLAQYILELTLLDIEMLQYPPSHVAAAALFLSNTLRKRTPAWPAAMVGCTKFTEGALEGCAARLRRLLEQQQTMALSTRKEDTNSLRAVYNKFCRPEFSSVARVTY